MQPEFDLFKDAGLYLYAIGIEEISEYELVTVYMSESLPEIYQDLIFDDFIADEPMGSYNPDEIVRQIKENLLEKDTYRVHYDTKEIIL